MLTTNCENTFLFNVLKISVHTSVLFSMYLQLKKKKPLTFTDCSSTKHLRKYFSSDAFIHRIKNMQILKPSSISPVPRLLAGKFQPSDGNFTVSYFLLEVCYTNMILKWIPINTQPTSKFCCAMPTLSKILQLILLYPEEWLAEIWILWKITWL